MLDELLGIRYPVIQGGMAYAATGRLAAACSEAGALGVIGSGGMNEADLIREIHYVREHTSKPFGVNLVLTDPLFEVFAELVIEEKVPIVTTGGGNPVKYIRKWKEAGCKVLPVIGNSAFTNILERAGADVIIAEGCESGGHIGDMNTMTLVPEVCKMTKLPVVAAGGIATKCQFDAAIDLGACGVQMGTRFLASQECEIHSNYKQAILKAKGHNTVVTGRDLRNRVRQIKNRFTSEYMNLELKGSTDEELNIFAAGSLKKAAVFGDVEMGSIMAGQACGQINEILSVKEILERICG